MQGVQRAQFERNKAKYESYHRRNIRRAKEEKAKDGSDDDAQDLHGTTESKVRARLIASLTHLRLVDFFNKLDTDGSMSLSREEFKVCSNLQSTK